MLPSRLQLLNTPTVPLQKYKTHPNECPVYDNKQSDGEVPMMQEIGECRTHFYSHCSQVHSGPESKHLIGTYLSIK